MKELTFTQTNEPVSIGAVTNAETILGVTFPNSYREFLLKHNGGLSKEGIFSIPNYGQSSIIFLGIGTGEEFSDLVLNYQAYKKRLPENVIPIGFDPGGNLICLVSIRDDWSIYFWDHETENTLADISKMFRIADNFSEFIDSLQEEDNETW